MKPEPVKPDRRPLDEALERLEAKRARVDAERGVMPARPECGFCAGTGWEPVGTTGPVDDRPVKRCRRGCEIPQPHHLQRRNEPRRPEAGAGDYGGEPT